MKHLDLFSGIGGFSLALESTGYFETVGFVEWDKWCRKVLEKHWPSVPAMSDICNVTVDNRGNLLYIDDDGNVNIGGCEMGAKRKTRYDHAVRLYESGMSVGDCAEFYEITRQAMHKILERRGCEFRPQLKTGSDNHFHRGGGVKNGQKRAAHILEKAVKKGVVVAKTRCEVCGETKTFKDGRSGIQAHHPDYNKPLEVVWMCQQCHHEWHRNNKAKEIKEEPARRIHIVTGGFP